MPTTPVANRPTPVHSTASDSITWGPVHLNVVEPSRSLAFWRDLVGLRLLAGHDDALRLGVEDAELVVLHPGATGPTQRGHAGLYHLAIHLPSEAEFARVLARLFSARYPHAPTDHIMHWATYLDDPDGIMLELSFETFDRFARYELARPRPAIVDSAGHVRDATAPLDLDEIFSYLPDGPLEAPLPAMSRIGHVHLHVAELEPAVRFYEAVGFTHGVTHRMGMTELHAGGSFPHRLALNIWQGIGAPPAPEGAAGMRHAVLRSADVPGAAARVRALGAEIEEYDLDASIRDPSGNRIHLTN